MKPRIVIQIRVSRAEKRYIQRRAKLNRMSVSAYIRMLTMPVGK